MRRLLALTATLSLLGAAPALAEDLEFTLTNLTGANVVAFHVSHAGTDEWEENLMEGAYLPRASSGKVDPVFRSTRCSNYMILDQSIRLKSIPI